MAARLHMTTARWFVFVLLVAIAAVAAAGAVGVFAAQFDAGDPAAIENDLVTGDVARVADIAAADGRAGRGVFVQVTHGGRLCIWDAVSATSRERHGGCNPVSDPLGGTVLSASLAYEGGPSVPSVRDARIVGLAAPNVAAIELVMSDGTTRSLESRHVSVGSKAYTAFGYRVRASDLHEGVGPTAVVALDADGSELGRQTTGIG
jgi:hypothetical protein